MSTLDERIAHRRATLRCDMHQDLRADHERLGHHEDDRVYTPAEKILIRELSGHGRCERCTKAVYIGSDAFRTDEQDASLRETIAWVESLGLEWRLPSVDREERKR